MKDTHPLRRARIALTALAPIIALTALSGCAALAPQPADAADNTLRIALDSDPVCADAHQSLTNSSLNITRATVDSLTDQDPQTGELVPWLAESWEVSADSEDFTFHLRPDVHFQDGTDFTAQSVKDNFETIIDMGAQASLGSSYLAGLSSIDVIDDHTVTVSFEQPNAQFLQATSTASLGFYAESTLALSADERCTTGLVGTGPFAVESFEPAASARLVRNDDYAWPSALADHTGPAHLAAIDFQVVPEASVRTGALSAGEVDIDSQVLPQNEELLEASSFRLATRPNPGLVYSLFPNVENPILSDRRVRQALNKAIDRSELQAVISKHQAPATSLVAQTTPQYTDQSELLEYDPQAAAQLLDEAGWTMDEETGIRRKDGQPLRFSQLYWQTAPFLELVQQQLREIGVDFQIRKSSVAEVSAVRSDRSYDFDFFNSTRADSDIVRTHLSANTGNRNNREPEALDDTMVANAAAMDPDKRQDLTAHISSDIITEGYAIPLVELSAVMAVAPRVSGFKLESNSRMTFYDTAVGEAR